MTRNLLMKTPNLEKTTMTNNSVPVSTLENNPLANEYKFMVKVLGVNEEETANDFTHFYTWARVYPQSWNETGLNPNEKERQRLQLTFNKNTYPNWKNLKEQLRPNRVLIIFGKLSETVSEETGGRYFSVYRLALMPENIIEIKDDKQGSLKIKIE